MKSRLSEYDCAQTDLACADPGRFGRGGPTLTTVFLVEKKGS